MTAITVVIKACDQEIDLANEFTLMCLIDIATLKAIKADVFSLDERDIEHI